MTDLVGQEREALKRIRVRIDELIVAVHRRTTGELEKIAQIAEAALAARQVDWDRVRRTLDEAVAAAVPESRPPGHAASEIIRNLVEGDPAEEDYSAWVAEGEDFLRKHGSARVDTERPDEEIRLGRLLHESERKAERLREEAEGTHDLLTHFRDDRQRLGKALRDLRDTERPDLRGQLEAAGVADGEIDEAEYQATRARVIAGKASVQEAQGFIDFIEGAIPTVVRDTEQEPPPQPKRFELSQHPDFGYRVSVPNLLPRNGERVAVREDTVTPEDVRRLADRLEDNWHHSRADAESEAHDLLSLVLGSDKDGS